jgi:hypothetical protein
MAAMRARAQWLLLLLAPGACDFVAYADRQRIPAGQGGAASASSSSTTGSATTTGSGGGDGGGPAPCFLPADCPGTDTECHVRTCEDGVCGVKDTAQGTALAEQVTGDCRQRVCDGDGGVAVEEDDADVLDDHNPCTKDVCVAGFPENLPLEANPACSGGFCDGAGRCVPCVVGTECATPDLCVDNRCVPQRCIDGKKDGDETDVDCGGPTCAPCATGGACGGSADCASGVCDMTKHLCLGPTCSDGVENGGETDVDCGGPCLMLCGPGRGCRTNDDCVGESCSGSVCLPSCIDGVEDGAETGVDCGGYACLPCADGEGCRLAADCTSGLCNEGRCVAASCVDGKQDGDETDVDCGGSCAPCQPGSGCTQDADCTSGICAGTLCATPSACGDGGGGGGGGNDGGAGCTDAGSPAP